MQSPPRPRYLVSLRSILILSTHLRLCLLSGLLPSAFPSKTLYTPLSSPIRATCPVHLILLDFITRTILGEEYSAVKKHSHAWTTLPLRISLHRNSSHLNTVNTFTAQCNSSQLLLRNFPYSPASLSSSCVRILPLAVCFKA